MTSLEAHREDTPANDAPVAQDIPIYDYGEFIALLEREPHNLLKQPCVVRGFVSQWQASESWTSLDKLEHEFGSYPVTAGAPQFTTNKNSVMCQVQTDFGHYLDYIRQPDRVGELFDGHWIKGDLDEFRRLGMPLYCGNIRIVRHSREPVFSMIDPAVPGPLECLNNQIPYYYQTGNHLWLYVSISGALTPLHQDNNDVIAYLAQLKGRKEALLYSPEDKPYFYKDGVGYMDPLNPDEDAFPDWRRARPWKATLNEGELLIWGPSWAHHVRTMSDSITVSFDIVNSANIAGYTCARDWRDELGHFARSNAGLIRERMADPELHRLLADGGTSDLGRRVMICVLRAARDASPKPWTDAVKREMLEILESEDER